MVSRDRRLGFRVPLDIFLNQYYKEKQFRALTTNVSDTGLHLQLVKSPWTKLKELTPSVGLEFELPGTGENIWARGEVCYERVDPYFRTVGIRFTAMPTLHARMVRDFCVETRRSRLGEMLARIRTPRGQARAAA